MLQIGQDNGAVLWTCILETGRDAQVPGGGEGEVIKTAYVHKQLV